MQPTGTAAELPTTRLPPTCRRLGDPPPAELLDSAERMSVDELRAVQLERLR